MMKKLKRGFTLAEVLITLGIIGVVAAITIPALITKYQKQVTVTQLKKAYSEFSQVIQKAEADYGSVKTWNFADFDTATDRANYFGENYLFPYMNILEKCVPTSSKCWADDVEAIDDGVLAKGLNNNQSGHISFITASGYSVTYWIGKNGDHIWYVVDVNGLKKPNKQGKDIFRFTVRFGNDFCAKVFPAGLCSEADGSSYSRDALLNGEGLEGNTYVCKKGLNTQYGGIYCAAVILLDGWKISDDYPW